jgi:hypothetical protein
MKRAAASRVSLSDDPNDYSIEELEKALAIAAKLLEDPNMATWFYSVTLKALEERRKSDDIRAHAAAFLKQMPAKQD